jgi:hypothetical protein
VKEEFDAYLNCGRLEDVDQLRQQQHPAKSQQDPVRDRGLDR